MTVVVQKWNRGKGELNDRKHYLFRGWRGFKKQ